MMKIATIAALVACSTIVADDFDHRIQRLDGTVRFATFNVSLHRRSVGELANELTTGKSKQANQIAEIVQRVRPDVLLLNEFDFDPDGKAARGLIDHFLAVGQGNEKPIRYPFVYSAPVNTGVPSGFDLNNDGKISGAADCFGYGAYPGQYGMLILSRFPIVTDQVRTFQRFLWKDMPDALLPVDPSSGEPFYSEDELAVFRLSSKSHWDVPIKISDRTVHFLVAHPTPPVFDGAEDRNGKRNHDEIRLFADYIDPGRSSYLYDDRGHRGGLKKGDLFVIAGDYNADPFDGDSTEGAIRQIVKHPLIDATITPESEGAVKQAAKQGGVNLSHRGEARFDTADFRDQGRNASGNLRIDYVLPSRSLKPIQGGVFWPTEDHQREFELIKASDHRMVWLDISVRPSNAEH